MKKKNSVIRGDLELNDGVLLGGESDVLVSVGGQIEVTNNVVTNLVPIEWDKIIKALELALEQARRERDRLPELSLEA